MSLIPGLWQYSNKDSRYSNIVTDTYLDIDIIVVLWLRGDLRSRWYFVVVIATALNNFKWSWRGRKVQHQPTVAAMVNAFLLLRGYTLGLGAVQCSKDRNASNKKTKGEKQTKKRQHEQQE